MSGAPESFNASVYLVDRQVEAGHGDRIAVAGPAGTLTYAELAARAGEFASGLGAAGVRPEDRVFLVMSDRPETLVTILAVMRMGAVAVPVSTMYNGAELDILLRDARARVVVATPEFETAVREALARAPEAETLIVVGDPPPKMEDGTGVRVLPPEAAALIVADGLLTKAEDDTALRALASEAEDGPDVRAWADVLAEGRLTGPAEPYETWADSPALWLYTSGTTGTPKAAMHRHGGIRSVCETYGRQVLGITPDDRCFSVARLFFAYGMATRCSSPGRGGDRDPRPGPRHPGGRRGTAGRAPADAVLRRARPSSPRCSPPTLPDDAFASVRLAVSAGEALPAELHRRFTDRFGVDIIDGLGSTEALHIFISNRPGRGPPGHHRHASCPATRPAPRRRGRRGRRRRPRATCTSAATRSPPATGAAPPTTRQVFQGEWLRTGDTYVRERRRLLPLPRPLQRHDQGGRDLGVARRGRGPPPPARVGRRVRGGRLHRRGRPGEARRLRRPRRRAAGGRRRADRVLPRRTGPLQTPA